MDLLKQGLRDVIDKNRNNLHSEQDSLKQEEQIFSECYNSWKSDPCSGLQQRIPRFFRKVFVPGAEETLPSKLRDEARGSFLQRRNQKLLDNDELRALWLLLDSQSTPGSGDEQMIDYDGFKVVIEKAGPKAASYLSAELFIKLQQNDPLNRVSIMELFNYVMRKVWLHQTRIGLSLYDHLGHGYLKESALENYILDLIPTLTQLENLEKTFHSFYVCTAARKFLFFLDPLRTGKIRIQDILTCGFLDDLLELRDETVPKDAQEANWFSAKSTLRVYGEYLNLDRDHNGMLNKEELASYNMGVLTSTFIDRVFQECLTYEGEMDYKTYLDFVLALENRHEPQALQYFFRILDIDGKGYLDLFTLNYFYRAIKEKLVENGQEAASFQDVKDEIFDMVKPKDLTRITLQDLIKSGVGGTVVSILIDLHGFWSHENREASIAAEDHADI